jgi:serine/threonine protein kinase
MLGGVLPWPQISNSPNTMNGLRNLGPLCYERMSLLEPGATIRETYEVERFLGEGAFAEVFRVKHRFLGRQAMKVFKRTGMNLDDIHEMLGEAILLSRIGHPNIVRVFDANVFDAPSGRCGYFTMEYVPGGSLHKFWQSHGGNLVPLSTSLDLIKQVCRGMALAHQESPPIIHRDIKPHNILVGYEADGLRARVSDFGLAKKVNPLTLLATTAGTLAFKPPEAFQERQGDSPASDVWAIGATFYMLLTDKLPLDSPSRWDPESARRRDTPITPPSQINPDVDGALDEIVMRSLHKDPRERYSSARELLAALEAWKPAAHPRHTRASSSTDGLSKSILGPPPTRDDEAAKDYARRAIEAKKSGRLSEAADLMEEAFNKSPDLRTKHEHQVKLWRCGIAM